MSYLFDNFHTVAELFLRHTWISVVSTLIGFVIAIPIGWFANKHRVARGILVAIVGALYTLPSLAVFVLLPAIIGTPILSVINVIVALAMYAVAVMVRSATDAFESVSDEVLDAASAAGYSKVQRFFSVELPLAGPVLMAGLRVVSVSTVSMLSVATLIGQPNLGSLFTDGYRRDYMGEIVTGIVAVALLAILLDLLIVAAGRVLMPWISPRVATPVEQVPTR